MCLKTKLSDRCQFIVSVNAFVFLANSFLISQDSYSQKMSGKHTNTTNFCASKVSFEFREISPELAQAKHARIMRMFAEALARGEREVLEERTGAEM